MGDIYNIFFFYILTLLHAFDILLKRPKSEWRENAMNREIADIARQGVAGCEVDCLVTFGEHVRRIIVRFYLTIVLKQEFLSLHYTLDDSDLTMDTCNRAAEIALRTCHSHANHLHGLLTGQLLIPV